MQHNTKADRYSTSLPEVVPASSLEADADRNNDWSTAPHSMSSPSSDSDYTNSQQAAATPKYLLDSQGSEHGILPMHGFRKTTRKKFAALIALGVFLFTTLAFSTGLGIPLAKCRNRFSPNNYAPLPPGNINTVKFNGFCDKNGELTRQPIYNASGNAQFDLFCGQDFTSGLPALNPSTGATDGRVRDMVAIVAYSVGSCIEACASMNELAIEDTPENPKCQSVTFTSQMQASVNRQGGNCFLKNATLANLDQAYIDNDIYVSAEVHLLRL